MTPEKRPTSSTWCMIDDEFAGRPPFEDHLRCHLHFDVSAQELRVAPAEPALREALDNQGTPCGVSAGNEPVQGAVRIADGAFTSFATAYTSR